MSDGANAPTLFERWGEVINDGFQNIAESGLERVAADLRSDDSHNPRTHAVTQDIGRNADGTTVTAPIQGTGVASMSTSKKLLIGGVAVLGLGLVLSRLR